MISSLCLASRAYCLIVARTVLSLEYLKRITRIASMIFPVDRVFLAVSKGWFADCVKIFRSSSIGWLIRVWFVVFTRFPPQNLQLLRVAVLEGANSSSASREFPTFYGSLRFNTGFTKARLLSVSWTRSLYSKPPFCHHITSHVWRRRRTRGGSPACGFGDRLATYGRRCHEME